MDHPLIIFAKIVLTQLNAIGGGVLCGEDEISDFE